MRKSSLSCRIFAAAAAAAMALSLAPAYAEEPGGMETAGAEPPSVGGFPDVPADSPFYDGILWCAEQGITGGYKDGSFQPAGTVTRAQFCTMLSRAFYPEDLRTYSTKPYTDQGWFVPNTMALCANGVLEGTSFAGSSASPADMDRDISRYDMAQLMANIMANKGFTASASGKSAARAEITDYRSIPGAYRDAVEAVYALGIIGGYGDGSFRGTAAMNRGQGAVVIYRTATHLSFMAGGN